MDKELVKQSLDTAVKAATKAGKALRELLSADIKINSSVGKDIKLEADLVAEKAILDTLHAESAFGILSEEAGEVLNADGSKGDSQYQWIVDPLDGSLNFSRGIDIFCTSIGLWNGSEPVLGVVYDFMHDRLFTGVVGEGAWLNGEPISVSSIAEKKDSILATGFPVYLKFDTAVLQDFVKNIQDYKKVRLFGSAATSLAYVARGSVEAYAENNIAIWDVAAGLALVLAAGGKADISNGTGKNFLNVYAYNSLIQQ